MNGIKRRKRTILLISGLMLAAVIGVALYHISRLVSTGVAYKAKILCSGVFVSNREPSSILSTDLAADDLSVLRHIDARVDYASRQATAGFFGIIKRKAAYQPGTGCTLTYGSNDGLSSTGASAAPPASAIMPVEYEPRFNTALDWAFSEPDSQRLRRTRAVVIVHEGKIVAERYAAGFSKDTPLLGWSMAKSVMNALVGIMIGEGRLSLDGPLPVPEWREAGDKRRDITLGHLLHMSSGLRFDEDNGNPLADATCMLLGSPDMASFAARKPLEANPGERWSYSSGTTNIISRVIRQVVGDDGYTDFPRRELFHPIGMNSAVIEQDASGTFVGSSFMYATARDWARFGQLYLQDGMWAGRRVLPEGWVKYTREPAPLAPDKQYGAHFWLRIPKEYRSGDDEQPIPADAFHAVGHEGQFISILPLHRLVIVRLGLTRYPSAWQHDKFVRLVLEEVK